MVFCFLSGARAKFQLSESQASDPGLLSSSQSFDKSKQKQESASLDLSSHKRAGSTSTELEAVSRAVNMVSVCVWEHSPVGSRVKHSYREMKFSHEDNALVFVTLLLPQIFRYFYLQVIYVSHKMPIKLPDPLSHRLVTSTKDPAAATLALCLPRLLLA